MKSQWGLLLALVFALIVAVFAVVNVEPVSVHFLFGTAQWPLVLVILVSALTGALAVGGFGMYRMFLIQRKIKTLLLDNKQLAFELKKLGGTPFSEETNKESKELDQAKREEQ